MTLKSRILLFFIVLGTSGFALGREGYDRKSCDKKIGIDNYIHAGSLDDESAGGKTYNFVKIISNLENEALGSETPRADHFQCLDNLFEKAKSDASEYWGGRLIGTPCVVSGSNPIPAVKPESCDQDLWDKYQENMNYIEKMSVRKAQLESKCKLGQGKCDSNAGIRGIQDMAGPMAAAKMDSCCDTNDGPAFRVLRTTYTIEFSKFSDADLQKECYKRTRPNQENSWHSWSAMGGCFTNIIKGFFESMNKLLKSVASLFDLGLMADLARVLGKALVSAEGRTDLYNKIGVFLEEIGKQVFSQAYASTSCFTGAYGTQQWCRLISGLVTDYIAGGKMLGLITKFIKYAGKPIALVAKGAAEFVNETPAFKAMKNQMAKVSEGAKNIKIKAQVGSNVLKSTAKEAAAQMVAKMKPYTSIRKMVSDKIKVLQKQAEAAGKVESKTVASTSPNAQAVVELKAPPSAPPATTAVSLSPAPGSLATNAISEVGITSGGSIVPRKLSPKLLETESAVKKMMSKYKEGVTPSEDAFGKLDIAKKARRATNVEKMAAIDRDAEIARKNVRTLRDAGRFTESQASRAIEAIDKMQASLANKLGVPKQAGTIVRTAEIEPPKIAESPELRPSQNSQPRAQAEIPSEKPPELIGDTAPGPHTKEPAVANSGAKPVGESPAPTASQIKFPSVDLETVLNPAKALTKTTESAWNRLSNFTQKAYAEAEKSAPNMRSSVFGDKGPWSITRDAIRRHADVETLYRNGLIDAERAGTFHNIIEVTEKNARDAATAYSQNYLNPSRTAAMASKLFTVAKPAVVASTGIGFTQYNSAINYKKLSDPRFDSDTVDKAFKETDALSADPAAVSKKFEGLKTQDQILAAADELRVRAKTVESYLKSFGSPEDKQNIADLLVQIKNERDKALAKLEGLEYADPEVSATPAGIPRNSKGAPAKIKSAQPKTKVKAAPPAPEAAVPPARAEGAAQAADPAGPPDETPIGGSRR